MSVYFRVDFNENASSYPHQLSESSIKLVQHISNSKLDRYSDSFVKLVSAALEYQFEWLAGYKEQKDALKKPGEIGQIYKDSLLKDVFNNHGQEFKVETDSSLAMIRLMLGKRSIHKVLENKYPGLPSHLHLN